MINAPLPHNHLYNEHDLTDAYHSRVWGGGHTSPASHSTLKKPQNQQFSNIIASFLTGSSICCDLLQNAPFFVSCKPLQLETGI